MRRRAGVRVRGCGFTIAVALTLLGCSVSEDQEVELGRRNAAQVEALTVNLVSVNRRYKAHAGIKITDV